MTRKNLLITFGIIFLICISSLIYYISTCKNSLPEPVKPATPAENLKINDSPSGPEIPNDSPTNPNVQPINLVPDVLPERPVDEDKSKYPIFQDGKTGYRVLLHYKGMERIAAYKADLEKDMELCGKRLRSLLEQNSKKLENLLLKEFLNVLLATKKPIIFAESEIFSSGNAWSTRDAQALGELSVVMPVKIFDDGRWSSPKVYQVPLDGYLMFTPGALLVKQCNVDYPEVVQNDVLADEDYYNLYERRLLPSLQFANNEAGAKGTKAVVTVPGIGCGQFAGPFKGKLEVEFNKVLRRILANHSAELTNISLLYFSDHSGSKQQVIKEKFSSTNYLLIRGAHDNNFNLLERPEAFNSLFVGDDFTNHIIFAFVAWDHLSFPGNDFFKMSRSTDDGVKAAATSSMTSLLGSNGHYDTTAYKYFPDATNVVWEELAIRVTLEFNE